MSSRNSFPENHRLFAGFLVADRARIVQQLAGSDLILVLGAPVFTYHVEGEGPHIPAGAQLLQLTDDPAAAARCPVGISIVTNLKLGVAALLAQSADARGQGGASRTAPNIPPRASPLPGGKLTDAYLLQRIAALRPANSIVVEEAPSSRGALHDRLPMVDSDSFYTCASGGLGHGLPAAVGVALASPERKVIALIGDGSAMYAIQGLWSAARLGVPVAFIIVNNASYQALEDFGRHFNISELPGVQLPDLDFCALATGHDVRSLKVDQCEDLDAALQQVFAAKVPMLLEVRVER
jgi:benzoylformate decarboxylase